MNKTILAALAVSALFAIAPASAQMAGAMDCTEDNMAKGNSAMMAMPAGEKKEMAMKEMGMAKDMMAKKDMAGCKTSMNKAMEMTEDKSKENKPVDGMKK